MKNKTYLLFGLMMVALSKAVPEQYRIFVQDGQNQGIEDGQNQGKLREWPEVTLNLQKDFPELIGQKIISQPTGSKVACYIIDQLGLTSNMEAAMKGYDLHIKPNEKSITLVSFPITQVSIKNTEYGLKCEITNKEIQTSITYGTKSITCYIRNEPNFHLSQQVLDALQGNGLQLSGSSIQLPGTSMLHDFRFSNVKLKACIPSNRYRFNDIDLRFTMTESSLQEMIEQVLKTWREFKLFIEDTPTNYADDKYSDIYCKWAPLMHYKIQQYCANFNTEHASASVKYSPSTSHA
jgi:hypothetical protein